MKTKHLIAIAAVVVGAFVLLILDAFGQATPGSYNLDKPMPASGALPGTFIKPGSPYGPANYNSTRPATWDVLVGGGYRSMGTTTERDAIPADWRKEGMLVWVAADNHLYKLGSSLTNWTDLGVFSSVAGGGGGSVTGVTASAPLLSSGGTAPNISLSSGSTSGHVMTWNGSAWAGAALPSSVTSVAASAPLASSGGATPTISLQAGSTSGHVLTWNGSAWAGAAPSGGSSLFQSNQTLTTNRMHNGGDFGVGFTNMNYFDVTLSRNINLLASNRVQIAAWDPTDTANEQVDVTAGGDLTLRGDRSLYLSTPNVNATTATVGQYLTLINATTGLAEYASLTFPAANWQVVSSGQSRTIYPRSASVVATPAFSSTFTTDASTANHFRITLTGNLTLANPTNPQDGQRVTWELIQDGTGGRTLTLGNQFAFGDVIPDAVLSTAASKRDFLTAVFNSATTKWYVVGFSRGY